MSGKIRNPERRCRICGNRCEKVMRYCKACARAIKEDRARACCRPLAIQEGGVL